MLATVAAWLASQGASLLLGFLANVVTTAIKNWQDNKNATQLGQVTVERDQATAAWKAVQAELEASKAAPVTVDDTAKRLEAGTA